MQKATHKLGNEMDIELLFLQYFFKKKFHFEVNQKCF